MSETKMKDAHHMTDARTEASKLIDVLHRNGFVRCDIAACNCGSWHARYGLRERMNEIIRELTDAGVLNNSTGNLPLTAINHLIADRDRLSAEVLRLQAERDAMPKVAFRFLKQITTNAYATTRWLPIAEFHHYGADGNLVEGAHPDWKQVEFAYAALSPATSTGSEVGK